MTIDHLTQSRPLFEGEPGDEEGEDRLNQAERADAGWQPAPYAGAWVSVPALAPP
jgi:hypothetical protein